jgi:hypothetical protein
MRIKFTESHSFLGEEMAMQVGDKIHQLDLLHGPDYADHAVFILKNEYNFDLLKEDVKFEWDGTL